MAQWINILQNNGFVNLLEFTFLCKKTGTVALVQPGLTAGGQAGSQADKMLLHLEIFKIIFWMKHWKFIGIQKGTV